MYATVVDKNVLLVKMSFDNPANNSCTRRAVAGDMAVFTMNTELQAFSAIRAAMEVVTGVPHSDVCCLPSLTAAMMI